MKIRLHPHARERLFERGVTEEEVAETVKQGESFPAKFGRTGFRQDFPYGQEWQRKRYDTKQVEAYGVREGEDWLMITVITRFF